MSIIVKYKQTPSTYSTKQTMNKADILKEIDEQLDIQESLVRDARAEFKKAAKGNDAAVTRARKAQMNLSKTAKVVRDKFTQFREAID